MGDNTKYGPGREFVRGCPEEMNHGEVARRATEAGIPMTRKQAQQWRYLIKREKKGTEAKRPQLQLPVAAAASPSKPSKPNTKPAPPKVYATGPASNEARLRTLIFAMGFDAVELVLEEAKRWARGEP